MSGVGATVGVDDVSSTDCVFCLVGRVTGVEVGRYINQIRQLMIPDTTAIHTRIIGSRRSGFFDAVGAGTGASVIVFLNNEYAYVVVLLSIACEIALHFIIPHRILESDHV